MKKVVADYDSEIKIHVILDNASVHLSDEANKWLAQQKGRVFFHFTPTSASWMNQIVRHEVARVQRHSLKEVG
jgi:transposase